MFFGLALVVVGIIFLLEKFGIISGSIWGFVRPSLIILFGITMIFHKRRWGRGWHWNCCCTPDDKEKSSPNQ